MTQIHWEGSLENFIPSQNRHQMCVSSLESMVDQDNPVRLIDAFLDQLDLVKLNS